MSNARINIPARTTPPFSRSDLSSLNARHAPPLTRSSAGSINKAAGSQGAEMPRREPPPAAAPAAPAGRAPAGNPQPAPPADIRLPVFQHPLRKGQKTPLDPSGRGRGIKACFGWNIRDGRCDVDASAFLVRDNGRVPGDEWFVFYGQPRSPDGSVELKEPSGGSDRKLITADLGKLSPDIQRIVFVVTIHEALERGLNFSMLKDTYIRLLDAATGQEIVSYCLEEYYQNLTSMTIGELYIHNGQWKFNPVGNGVNRDLAGQCAVYGVVIG